MYASWWLKKHLQFLQSQIQGEVILCIVGATSSMCACVNDLVWTHVGPSPGDREGLSVPGVLSILHGQAMLSGYLSS